MGSPGRGRPFHRLAGSVGRGALAVLGVCVPGCPRLLGAADATRSDVGWELGSPGTEHENKDGEDSEWQNRVDDDIVYSDDNNEGYASGQSGQFSALEQNDDVETQFSEDNNDFSEGQYSTDYNDIDEASKNMQNNHSYVDEVDEFCIDAVKYITDGVNSRKDKETRNSFIRLIAFNFEDRELHVAKVQSIVDPVNSYICPETICTSASTVEKRPTLKRQMTTQAQTNTTCFEQARGATTQGQTSQALTRQATAHT